jgi:DNA-binding SARP family transcriptional activator
MLRSGEKTELALSEEQTASLLSAHYGLTAPETADRVYELTLGLPVLVHACAESLVIGVELKDSTVIAELCEGLPGETVRLLAELAAFAPVSAGLAEALGHPGPAKSLRQLTEIGLLRHGRIVPLAALVTLAESADAERLRELAGLAGRWYEAQGMPGPALRAYALGGDDEACARVLEEHGQAMVSGGDALSIVEVLTRLRSERESLRLLLGDAQRTTGAVAAAAQSYAAVAAARETVAAQDDKVWDAELAWRVGQVHYLRGDHKGALAVFARAAEPSPMLLAWKAPALLGVGETSAAMETAQQAVSEAHRDNDERALATAQVALAVCYEMAADDVASAELLTVALDTARRAGDLVLQARVLMNQTYNLLQQAKFGPALETAKLTRDTAGRAGHANLQALALGNEAFALSMLGRYDEAILQFERMLALCRRMGSRRSTAAQVGLGEVYRRRGWIQLAHTAYETAIRLAEEGGDHQMRVYALAGLSRAVVQEDPKQAKEFADQAAEGATDRVMVMALLAQGWAAYYLREGAAAAELAAEAARRARSERDPAGLAESLELQAVAETQPKRARAALREAQAIWTQAGAVVDAARVACKLGALADVDADERLQALIAAETLIAAGVPVAAAQVPETVVIRAFGRFEVLVNDAVVPVSQWQSRKARDLLRILVARRGRPVPRSELCELLWPDDDQGKTGHRLSVLLSILKNVLDPGKALPPDHYVVADQASIGLDVSRLRADVEEFLADVAHGRRLRDRGQTEQAVRVLTCAEELYRADVFADEPYSDWSDALREEARGTYLTCVRMLAQLTRARGDLVSSGGYLLKLLAADPYDETSHRALVETLAADGRHGEARRAHTRYLEAMRAIGVPVTALTRTRFQ